MSGRRTPDITLVFPPQWSPFQPALALPSLKAWLERAGHNVRVIDANIAFYEWLLSDDCVARLRGTLDAASASTRDAYETFLGAAAAFRETILRVRRWQALKTQRTERLEAYVAETYMSSRALDTYLHYVSHIAGGFKLSPYNFSIPGNSLRVADIESFLADPPPLLMAFVALEIERILADRPRFVGLSCIGQEQLLFTLLFAQQLKKRTSAPIIVGGTIFSRIFERGRLPAQWFRYVDIFVRNEGELPLEGILGLDPLDLSAGIARVPGVIYLRDGMPTSTAPAAPLKPDVIPVPDFDELPLESYLVGEITLPILASRGCYWGKCEFCHHGMVYGEKYSASSLDGIVASLDELEAKYGITSFAFNDEAVPPKVFRGLSSLLAQNRPRHFDFTGLLKFENYFQSEDFRNAREAGFRSLYIGLESASERVLDLMQKRSTSAVMVRNLADATAADIWTHCFVFFGFPGETEADAEETVSFLMNNSGIIGSFGAGTFSLEHNAPIMRRLAEFGVSVREAHADSIDVYYDYDVDRGIGPKRAIRWMEQLNDRSDGIPSYRAINWIPREHLLGLLSAGTVADLKRISIGCVDEGDAPLAMPLSTFTIDRKSAGHGRIVMNMLNGRTFALKGPLDVAFASVREAEAHLGDIEGAWPDLLTALRSGSGERASHQEDTRPI